MEFHGVQRSLAQEIRARRLSVCGSSASDSESSLEQFGLGEISRSADPWFADRPCTLRAAPAGRARPPLPRRAAEKSRLGRGALCLQRVVDYGGSVRFRKIIGKSLLLIAFRYRSCFCFFPENHSDPPTFKSLPSTTLCSRQAPSAAQPFYKLAARKLASFRSSFQGSCLYWGISPLEIRS